MGASAQIINFPNRLTFLETADAITRSALAIQKSLERLIVTDELQPQDLPGWRAYEPSPQQAHEVRIVQLLEAVEGDPQPYIFAHSRDTFVRVQAGSVAFLDARTGQPLALRNGDDPSFLVLAKTHCAMVAASYPCKVVMMSWQDPESDGHR